MSRRRRSRPATPPKPFDGAMGRVDALEKITVDRMVEIDWGLEDVVRWLWPEGLVQVLRAAYPYSNRPGGAYQRYAETHVARPELEAGFMLSMDMDEVNMLCPAEGLACYNAPAGVPIVRDLNAILAICQRFNAVRQVVNWLQDNATPGAARYYFPSICSLLPQDHPVNRTDGGRYREPVVSMAKVVPLMREASVTVAGALMLNQEPVERKHLLTVHLGPIPFPLSQQFTLL